MLVYAICHYRKRTLSKFVFLVWFFNTLTLNIVPGLIDDETSIFHVKKFYNESYLQITVLYILCQTLVTYCEFRLSLLFYTPLYITAVYVLSVQ